MKKQIYFLAILLSLGFSLNAQLVENTDMEDWTSLPQNQEAPTGWITPNHTSNNFERVFCKKSTNAYSGNYAVQLLNHIQGSACYSSSLKLGNIDSDGNQTTGITFTERPTGMSFYYTYKGQHERNSFTISTPLVGYAAIKLLRWDAATNENIIVGEGKKYFGAQDNTTTFELAEVEVDYYSNDTPETMEILFKNPCDGYDSTEFSIDFVALNGLNTTNIEEPTLLHEFQAYPNPAQHSVTFKSVLENQKSTTIHVVDMQGKQVSTFSFSGNEKTIEVSEWADGVYFYHVIQNGKKLKSAKILVQK